MARAVEEHTRFHNELLQAACVKPAQPTSDQPVRDARGEPIKLTATVFDAVFGAGTRRPKDITR